MSTENKTNEPEPVWCYICRSYEKCDHFREPGHDDGRDFTKPYEP